MTINYTLAQALKDAGFPQDVIRRHINQYGTVFYTRKETDYPVCPNADQLYRALLPRLRCLRKMQLIAGDDTVLELFAKMFAASNY